MTPRCVAAHPDDPTHCTGPHNAVTSTDHSGDSTRPKPHNGPALTFGSGPASMCVNAVQN